MRRSILLASTVFFALITPALAFAADAAAPTSPIETIVASIAALMAAAAPGVVGWFKARQAKKEAESAKEDAKAADAKATRAEARAANANAFIDRVANAHQDGILLVLTYAGAQIDATPLLRVWGWKICEYRLQPRELLPKTTEFEADIRAADVVLLQGSSPEENATLFTTREFRDRTGSGVSVVSLVPKEKVWYDQTKFSPWDQSVTTAITAESAVRNGMERRAKVRELQGVRPGGIAAAKAELLAS